jgi:hypothetical protein
MRFAPFVLAALASSAIARPATVSFDRNFTIGHSVTHTKAVSLNAFVGLSAKGAAALTGCAIGLKAGSVDIAAREELKTWLATSDAVSIGATLKTSINDWCTGASVTLSTDLVGELSLFVPVVAQIAAEGGLVVSILGGVVAAAENAVGVVLDVTTQTALAAVLKVNGELDSTVKAALSVCAAGGVVDTLAADVKIALETYLKDAKCVLDATLKSSVLAWLEGTVETGVVAVGGVVNTAGALASASVGASVSALVDLTGKLTASATASLSTFLGAAVGLEADIKASLNLCAAGELAVSLTEEALASLTAWLATAECSLDAELKAVVLYWLYIASSVEAKAESAVILTVTEISQVEAFLTSTVASTLSATVRGAIGVCAAGESVLALTSEAAAELAAFLSGSVNVDISVDITSYLIYWLTGCSSHPPVSLPATPSASSVAVPFGTPSGLAVPSGAALGKSVPANIVGGSLPSVSSIPVSVPSVPASSPAPRVVVPSAPVAVPSVPESVASVPASAPAVPSDASVPSVPSVPASAPSDAASVPSVPATAPSTGSAPSVPVSAPSTEGAGSSASSTAQQVSSSASSASASESSSLTSYNVTTESSSGMVTCTCSSH